MSADIECHTCKFWVQDSRHHVVGECRKYAPRAAVARPVLNWGDDDRLAYFPRTERDVFCGEWEQTPVVDGEQRF